MMTTTLTHAPRASTIMLLALCCAACPSETTSVDEPGTATQTDSGTTDEGTDTATDEGTDTTDTGTDTGDADCGNGVIEADEQCDDGNDETDDGCTNSCTLPVCGDGIVQMGEGCDDGNDDDDDACSNECVLATCGNGLLDPGEACEDGNTDPTDGCTDACVYAACGDGIVWAGYEACDDANAVDEDACTTACEFAACGDGFVQPGETCEDGNDESGDGCVECLEQRVLQLSAGSGHVCALLDTGGVRCWGSGSDGKLGYANEESIGDDEHPFTAGDVNVGGAVVQVVAGAYHTCALLEGGAVRCWGDASSGALGSGNDDNIGDDEEPAIAGEVEIGGPVVQLAVGSRATCALLEGGALRCWGLNTLGKLGYGHTNTIGDDETPASAGDVNVGGAVIQVSMGPGHTCVVLDTGGVKCWGNGQLGCLGYASVSNIGDDEEPADYGEINIGGTAVQVGTGDRYTCVLLDTGGVKCWGWAQSGQLGYANTITIGDNEVPATVGEVDVGGVATRLSVGRHSTCVQVDGAARCWGRGLNGALGYGNTYNVGDNGVPAAAGDVDVGGGSPVDMISSGQYRVCVVLESGALRCWGLGSSGMLGHANTQTIGDNELPAMAGNVLIF